MSGYTMTAAEQAAAIRAGKQGQLTDRQASVLGYVVRLVAARGYPPSWQEMMREFGLSPNGVSVNVNALARKGYLSRERGKVRTLRVAGLAGGVTVNGVTLVAYDGTRQGLRLRDVLAGRAGS